MFLNNVLFMLWDISELRYDFRDFGGKNLEVYTFHVINQFVYKCCPLCEGKCQSCRKRNCCSKHGGVDGKQTICSKNLLKALSNEGICLH